MRAETLQRGKVLWPGNFREVWAGGEKGISGRGKDLGLGQQWLTAQYRLRTVETTA